MRQKRVWRYWCDFCRKGGCQKAAMVRHEKHCTMNPKRVCRMCDKGECHGQSLPHLIAIVRNDKKELAKFDIAEPVETRKQIIGALMDATEGCPACALAAFRQSGVEMWKYDFDYKKEVEEFWKRVNDDEYRADMQALIY